MNPDKTFLYITEKKDIICPEDGFITDLASNISLLYGIFPPQGSHDRQYGPAAVMHDWLYCHPVISGRKICRKEADELFREMLYDPIYTVSPTTISLLMTAIQLFGGVVWNRHRDDRIRG